MMASNTINMSTYKARIMAHNPSNTSTFLRGDNTFSSTLTDRLTVAGLYVSGSNLIQFADSGSWSSGTGTFPAARGGLYWTGTSGWVKLFAEETSSDNFNLIVDFGDDTSPSFILRDRGTNKITIQPSSSTITATRLIGGADTWYTARTLTVGNTGKSVNGSANVSWSKDEILGASTSAYFLRGDKSWTNLLTGNLTLTNGGAFMIDHTGQGAKTAGTAYRALHLQFRNSANSATYGSDVIRYVGTNGTDTYNTCILLGSSNGTTWVGAGESSAYLPGKIAFNDENLYLSADGSICFYTNGAKDGSSYTYAGYFSGGSFCTPNGSVWAGTNGNTTAERQVGVQSGAGQMYMYSQASTTGSRGIYLPAHGSGGAKAAFSVDTNNNVTFNGSLSGNATTCTYPLGFSSRNTNATWGNTTGSTATCWDIGGCSIDFRRDNPSSGKLSIKVDGRFYGNEGTYPAMLMRNENSYWGLCDPDAANSVWIRTTSAGLIPFQSGGRGSGHCGLGTSSWYFSYAYVDTYYANRYSTGHGYINGAATNGGLNMILAGDDIWLGDCNIGGRLGLKSNNTADAGIACYGSDGTRRGIFYANSTGFHSDVAIYNAVWNDFAEFRESDITEPGRIVISDGHGKLKLSSKRMEPSAHPISDTFGCSVGESDTAKTPIGVAGRVLVYTYQDRNNYKVGDCVCSAPNGTVDIMQRSEIQEYPDRIVGIVDEVPDYEVWHQTLTYEGGGGQTITNIEVKGRIWIYTR